MYYSVTRSSSSSIESSSPEWRVSPSEYTTTIAVTLVFVRVDRPGRVLIQTGFEGMSHD